MIGGRFFNQLLPQQGLDPMQRESLLRRALVTGGLGMIGQAGTAEGDPFGQLAKALAMAGQEHSALVEQERTHGAREKDLELRSAEQARRESETKFEQGPKFDLAKAAQEAEEEIARGNLGVAERNAGVNERNAGVNERQIGVQEKQEGRLGRVADFEMGEKFRHAKAMDEGALGVNKTQAEASMKQAEASAQRAQTDSDYRGMQVLEALRERGKQRGQEEAVKTLTDDEISTVGAGPATQRALRMARDAGDYGTASSLLLSVENQKLQEELARLRSSGSGSGSKKQPPTIDSEQGILWGAVMPHQYRAALGDIDPSIETFEDAVDYLMKQTKDPEEVVRQRLIQRFSETIEGFNPSMLGFPIQQYR